jgi:MFS family permease
VLFGVGGIGCALAPDIQTLVVLRFIQGLGAVRHGDSTRWCSDLHTPAMTRRG